MAGGKQAPEGKPEQSHKCAAIDLNKENKNKETPCLLVCKRTILAVRPPQTAKLLSTFAGKGCCAVSTTDS
jgi:hypothetical protein